MCKRTIEVPGDGPHLCQDEITGRFVMSSIDQLNMVAGELNVGLVQDGEVSLNEFYQLADMEPIPSGDDQGWSDKPIRIRFRAALTRWNEPAIVFSFYNAPRTAFDRGQ